MFYPFSLSLIGEFQDAYLYKGRLYLLNLEGELIVLNWDRLIRSLPGDRERFTYEWSFLRNDALLSKPMKDMLRDKETLAFLSHKLLSASDQEMYLEPEDWRPYVVGQVDFAVDDLTDVVLYRDVLYLSSVHGIYADRLDEGKVSSRRSSRSRIVSDIPTVGLSARYGTIVAACCEDGLFCYSDLRSADSLTKQYHSERFARANSWLRSDFLTLESDGVGYHINRTYPRTHLPSHHADETEEPIFEDDQDTRRLAAFGVDYLAQDRLLPGLRSGSIVPRATFSRGGQAFICINTDGRYEVVSWRRPPQEGLLQQRGLIPIAEAFPGIFADVFSGGAIDSDIIALDTDRGTAIVERRRTPRFISDDLNGVYSKLVMRHGILPVSGDEPSSTGAEPCLTTQMSLYKNFMPSSNPC